MRTLSTVSARQGHVPVCHFAAYSPFRALLRDKPTAVRLRLQVFITPRDNRVMHAGLQVLLKLLELLQRLQQI